MKEAKVFQINIISKYIDIEFSLLSIPGTLLSPVNCAFLVLKLVGPFSFLCSPSKCGPDETLWVRHGREARAIWVLYMLGGHCRQPGMPMQVMHIVTYLRSSSEAYGFPSSYQILASNCSNSWAWCVFGAVMKGTTVSCKTLTSQKLDT